MENLSAFVDCLNDYIIQHNLSVNKFAKQMGFAERAVANWLSMRYFPSIEYAKKIADVFDCSLDYLFGLSDNKTQSPQVCRFDFESRFQYLCEKKGVTPYRVAKECGFGESMISKWKRGKNPKTETLIRLANYFNCSLDYIAVRYKDF